MRLTDLLAALSKWLWPSQTPRISKRFVILAHSTKHDPGRCVAGRGISNDADGTIVPGFWIRPVSKLGRGELKPNHYRLRGTGSAGMFDIVDVPLRSTQNDPAQPENWVIDERRRWTRIGSLKLEDLSKFVEAPPDLWLEPGGFTDRVSSEHLRMHPPRQSLYLLRLPLCMVKPTEMGRPGFRLHFTYNGIAYRLKITDPLATARFADTMIGREELRLRDAIVCVSLGSPFQGFHYKLIASVAQPLSDRTLLTIGHSSRSIDEFVDLLKHYNVQAVADVRSQPYSARFPQFSKQALQDSLRQAGIEYVFLGRELGARREEREAYEDGRAEFARIARSDLFQAGLDRVIRGTERYRVALMCAEKDPLECHRAILICPRLREFGFNIEHILDRDRLETHAAAEQRLTTEERIVPNQLTLAGAGFDNPPAIIRAYELREEKIAFRPGEPSDDDLHHRVHPQVG